MLRTNLHRTLSAPRTSRALSSRASAVLISLGLPTSGEPVAGVYHAHGQGWHGSGELHESKSPATGETLARIRTASSEDVDAALNSARRAYESWRTVPAPKRGEVLRQVRTALHERIDDLGKLVSLEMGKVLSGEPRALLSVSSPSLSLCVSTHILTFRERLSRRLEGRGEVQEFVDEMDLAVGLSRSIGGTLVPSGKMPSARLWDRAAASN